MRRAERALCAAARAALQRHSVPLSTDALAAVYRSHAADAASVVALEAQQLPETLEPGDVRVRMLAAPVNPSDINMLQGRYALLPPLPAVGGNEGVGEVEAVGATAAAASGGALQPGALVLPAAAGLGTWRTHVVAPASAWLPLPLPPSGQLTIDQAAQLSINPCTALRLLADFVDLQPGDAVVQNGATSAVGLAVASLAAHRGVQTVNIVRDRPDFDAVAARLRAAGATVVLNERDLRTARLPPGLAGRARLGLNCVGGKSATAVGRLLAPGAVLVTYGGMSLEPVTLATSTFIFGDLTARGFWLTRWVERHGAQRRADMLREAAALVASGALAVAPAERFALADVRDALRRAAEPFRGGKVLLRLDGGGA